MPSNYGDGRRVQLLAAEESSDKPVLFATFPTTVTSERIDLEIEMLIRMSKLSLPLQDLIRQELGLGPRCGSTRKERSC